MKDFIKNYCEILNISLFYTNNKYLLLSYNLNKGIPTLRVHKIFKNCPKDVAESVIDYYFNTESKEKPLQIIKAYIEKHFPPSQYKIKPYNESLRRIAEKQVKKSTSEKNESLVELEILQITKEDFWGKKTNISPNNTIEFGNSKMIQLDIEVKDIK